MARTTRLRGAAFIEYAEGTGRKLPANLTKGINTETRAAELVAENRAQAGELRLSLPGLKKDEKARGAMAAFDHAASGKPLDEFDPGPSPAEVVEQEIEGLEESGLMLRAGANLAGRNVEDLAQDNSKKLLDWAAQDWTKIVHRPIDRSKLTGLEIDQARTLADHVAQRLTALVVILDAPATPQDTKLLLDAFKARPSELPRLDALLAALHTADAERRAQEAKGRAAQRSGDALLSGGNLEPVDRTPVDKAQAAANARARSGRVADVMAEVSGV